MTNKLRIVLAQINPTVGAIEMNLQKHISAAIEARDKLGAQLIVFPELGLTGYPPEDLLLRQEFINAANQALETFIQSVSHIYCVISHPYATPDGLYNACSLVYNGSIIGRYAKQHLPNYGVFDEDRYFIPGHAACVQSVYDIPVGLVICEDIWLPGPVQQAAARGARLLLSPNASPFEVTKQAERIAVLSQRASEEKVAIVYVNQVGGQDELIFDGGSMVISETGEVAACAGFFEEKLLAVDIDVTPNETRIATIPYALPSENEKIYQALVLALSDYIKKNRISGVLVGLSGGIDSALTLTIAVDALGSDRVHAIYMPSRYSSEMSQEDAVQLANTLGVTCDILSIEPVFQTFLQTLEPLLANTNPDITEENIQARCRAILLMAYSNKTGKLVLTTGNRSELAVGYCTLYGDMAGGFNVLKDIPKTLVFELATYRNTINDVIPLRTITRAPSAELAHNQKDEDSLPPYELLDQLLQAYINDNQSPEEIIAKGFDREVVMKVVQLVRHNQYKRNQSAIGPRINHKSFGKDWRYPITNQFTK